MVLSDIAVIRNFDQNLPKILVDSNQIQQVLFNLVNNAGDSISRTGKITITTGQNNETVYITVTDTGCCMDTEQIKKIFDPF